ncbi:MAG TPA: CGNR zinc finger domain-containing protein [Candidatus Limnocylindria bacterium]|nr:CGNR zinc finger domain-containing protein [Candidatus Limnocylindria bacterium]
MSVSADPELEHLVAFVNTIDLEAGRDEIGTPERLAAWLRGRGMLDRRALVDGDAHARAVALREGLRALGRANNGEGPDAQDLRDLAAATEGLPLVASLAPGSAWRLTPRSTGVDAYLGMLVATTVRAMASGEWSRVKACQNDVCRWLFIDRSRNRSHTWCSMAVCGSRAKSRAYRARRRATA